MPLKKGTSSKTFGRNVSEMMKAGHPQAQAVAAAYRQQRESRKRKRKARDGDDDMFDSDDSDVDAARVALSDIALLDDVHMTPDGYLACEARVARVGTQRYRGREVGLSDKEFVTLYRPPEEVFSHAAMRSMAFKPVTLTHPSRMVDKASWGKLAKGFSAGDIVRDGEYVKVPLMLADAAAIEAYENGVRELSVGYTTDIDWTPGETPSGEAYDGVQRDIRANHHALVPVARGGRNLRFGDGAGDEGVDGYADDLDDLIDRDVGEEERADLAKQGKALKGGGFPIRNTADLRNAIQAIGRAKNPAAAKALIKRRASELGATKMLPESWDAAPANDGEEGVAMVTIMVGGQPIEVADGVSAERLKNFLRDQEENFKGKKAKPFGNGGDDDDDDDTTKKTKDSALESDQERQKAERGFKDALSAKDGEIAMLTKKLKDAAFDEAKQEEVLKLRDAVKAQARKVLGDSYDFGAQTLTQIRRATVAAAMGGEKEIADMDDAEIAGAFRIAVNAQPSGKTSGLSRMTDGMSRDMRASAGQFQNGRPMTDADVAYEEYCKRISTDYRNVGGERRN